MTFTELTPEEQADPVAFLLAAFASTLEQDESFTTINLAINFSRPVWNDRLRAEAEVISRGKNVGYVECEIASKDGKQVAKAPSTCFVLRGEQSKQR